MASLAGRMTALEQAEVVTNIEHAGFRAFDAATADAVKDLTRAINDPKTGLIVELDRFRTEVRGWVRTAGLVTGGALAVITVVAPWVRALVERALNVTIPG